MGSLMTPVSMEMLVLFFCFEQGCFFVRFVSSPRVGKKKRVENFRHQKKQQLHETDDFFRNDVRLVDLNPCS